MRTAAFDKIAFKSHSQFSDVIDWFWTLPKKGLGSDILETTPHSNFILVIDVSDSGCKPFLAGPHMNPNLVPINNAHEYFGINFRPGNIPQLADFDPAGLVGTIIQIDKIPGIDMDELGEQLILAGDILSKQKLIEDALMNIKLESLVRREQWGHYAQLMASCGGQIKVHELASLAGTSIRNLERAFKEQIGIPPKKFIRIIRFQEALLKLKCSGSAANLADIAYDCGYTDESHLIKDFKSLALKLPSEV